MSAMLAALLLALQESLLVRPLALGATPPETRAVAAVRFVNGPGEGHDEAFHLARDQREGFARGEDFLGYAKALAGRSPPPPSGFYGTFPVGDFPAPVEQFLAQAAVGALSEPLQDGAAWWLVERLERDAACRQIFVAGTGAAARERAEALARELRAGADFQALARERSDDKASALRGGDLALYERGPNDALLREAAFRARIGEIVGPLESPLGFHLLQRVGIEALDPRLRDDVWAHARAILIPFGGALGADPQLAREPAEAERLANDLAARIRRGEDMAALAAQFDDDRGGRARAGDLGWVRRGTTAMPPFFDKLFTEPPGELLGPIASSAGFVLLRREDPGLRSRLVLRTSPWLDMDCWLRVGADRPPPSTPLARTLDAMRTLELACTPAELARVERARLRCAKASEFREVCDSLPAIVCRPGGGEVALRVLALELASALTELEPLFLERVWPEHARRIEASLAELRPALALLGDVALDELMADLGMADPRCVVAVVLVDHYGRGSRVMTTRPGEFVCIVEPDPLQGADRIRNILQWAAAALDLATADQGTFCSELRRRLGSLDGTRQPEASAVLSAETTHVVQRVFDARHVRQRLAIGWLNRAEGRAGGTLQVLDRPEIPTDPQWRAYDAWTEHLAGKTTREQALDAIVAAAAR